MTKPRILCVDDSQVVLMSLAHFLERAAFDVTTAESGQAALEILPENKFDIIMTDINMPDMTGLDMLEHARKGELIPAETIVLVMTTEQSAALKQRGRDLGVKAWIIKPYNEELLNKTLQKLLSR